MTAPDPGLTDLIAAEIARHRLRYGSEDAYNGERWLCTTCPWLMKANTGSRPNVTVIQAHANHVAERLKLVVEQHTNGRTAELEERIAEAQSLCRNTGRYNAARQKHWNIRVFACDVLAALKGRAALEGVGDADPA